MLCWSHTATSNTSSGLEPTGSAVALHHSKQLKDVENRWSMDYQDLPCRLCGLFVIVVQSEMCVCMCFGGGGVTFGAMLWVCACMLWRSRVCHRCITEVGGSRWAEWLGENREAVIRQFCLGHVFSLLKDHTSESRSAVTCKDPWHRYSKTDGTPWIVFRLQNSSTKLKVE